MAYQLVDGVYKYSESPSKEAVAWQGYDDFPGIDQYKDTIIKAGTELVKLEPSRSGYFTTREVYESLRKEGKVSAIEMSEGLQVAPWRNPRTDQYEYRSKVSFTVLEHDIVAAYGEQTLANQEYGEGTFVQIYIAGYDGVERENNESFGLKEIGSEELSDNVISKQEWGIIQDKHEQHLLKRNLFCYQKCKDDLISLTKDIKEVDIKEFCDKQIDGINKRIRSYDLRIRRFIKDEEIGNVQSPTYDPKNIYLHRKSINYEREEQKEIEVNVVHRGLMNKIEEEMHKPSVERKIDVDELLKSYKLNQFYQLSKEINRIDVEKDLPITESTMTSRVELFKKLSLLLNKQREIMKDIYALDKINTISKGKSIALER